MTKKPKKPTFEDNRRSMQTPAPRPQSPRPLRRWSVAALLAGAVRGTAH